MKKFLTLALVGLLSLSLVACGGSNEGGNTEEPNTDACAVKIGLVTDTGGIDDKSFNQSSWEGLTRYAEENNMTDCISYLQSGSEADYIPNLSQFADEGYDLVMAVGFLFSDAMKEVSVKYPETHFLLVDEVVEGDNVTSAVFSAEQGSFLVGVAAGLTAKENGSNAVGFMGGMEGPIIGAFQAGFEQGVLAVNPEATIYVDYADSFDDDSKGQNLAAKQYGAGATVVFQAAGACGNGVIKEAKERGDVWAVGVDRDQYEEGIAEEGGKSIILTSMLKRVDMATYTTAKNLVEGTLEAGTMLFDMSNDGVGAELTADRNLSAETIATVEEYAAKIKNGEITVDPTPTIKNGGSNK